MIHEERKKKISEDSDSLKMLKNVDEIPSREDLDILHSLSHIFPEPPSKASKLLAKIPSILWVSFIATLAFVIVNSGTDFLTKAIKQPIVLLGAKSGMYFMIVVVFYVASTLTKM